MPVGYLVTGVLAKLVGLPWMNEAQYLGTTVLASQVIGGLLLVLPMLLKSKPSGAAPHPAAGRDGLLLMCVGAGIAGLGGLGDQLAVYQLAGCLSYFHMPLFLFLGCDVGFMGMYWYIQKAAAADKSKKG